MSAPQPATDVAPILTVRGVSKTFPGVKALDNVDFDVRPGEGTGEFPMLIETLKKTGFDGYLTMEIGFNRRDVDPDAFAKRAYDYIKRLTEPLDSR